MHELLERSYSRLRGLPADALRRVFDEMPRTKAAQETIALLKARGFHVLLLSSGVPIMKALDITKFVLGNVRLLKVVEEARDSIREGESIAEPLARSGKFDPIVTHMIAIGEKSGQLEEMLVTVAEAYDAQVEARVSTLTALLEPVMILFMGGSQGLIILAIMSPLMRMNQFVQ